MLRHKCFDRGRIAVSLANDSAKSEGNQIKRKQRCHLEGWIADFYIIIEITVKSSQIIHFRNNLHSIKCREAFAMF